MAQDDYIISDQAGVAFLSDLNSQFAAAVTNNSGATEPAVKYAHMWWADTTAGLMKQRDTANNSWITRGSLTSAIIPDFESTGIDDNATSTIQTVTDTGVEVTGRVTVSGDVLVGTLGGAPGQLRFPYNSASAISRTWAIRNDWSAYGDLAIVQSTTQAGTTFNAKVTLDSAGKVLVGKAVSGFGTDGLEFNPTGAMLSTITNGGSDFNRLGSDGAIQTFWREGTAVGSITLTGSATSYNTSSDYRLKENMNVIEDDFILGVMGSIPIYTGNFIADPDETLGMYKAQEVYEQLPNVTSGTPDETEEYEVAPAVLDSDGVEFTPAVMGTRPRYMGMDHSKIVPYLHAYTQALHRRIEELEKRL
tara:strand:+ start:3864 stop:4949 length:1086 start_codon:yes stop_codon:yes gene_type:complete